MGSEVDEALLQSHEEKECETHDETVKKNDICIRFHQVLHNLKHLKSLEILKSALTNLTSNTKFMFLMILSSIPFFVIMVIYESNIHILIDSISESLVQPSQTYYYNVDTDSFQFYDEAEPKRNPIRNFLQLFPFHIVLSPLAELLTLTVITIIAVKAYVLEEKEATLKETIYEAFYKKFKFKGLLITCILVQLLSTSTIIGLFWTLANFYIVTSGFNYYDIYIATNSYVMSLLLVLHEVIFMGLLYKFLDWSCMWNMAIVISVLEEENGIDALEISSYCGKQSRQTGFQLMLFFFVYGVVVRLPILLCEIGNVNVTIIGLVVFLVCLGNVLKWVALVLYYCECKAHIFLKKVDEEVGKAMKIGEV